MINVNASNVVTPVTTNVVVLGYSCQYQGGYVYAFDDAMPNTGSVGGKVATTTDQASAFPNGIIWSSNGVGGATANVSYNTILGIDETSTTGAPSPPTPAYPSRTPTYTACNGSSDGRCNSNNIVSYYNFNRASGGSAPTPLNYYAAGLCKQTISGYSDWYLPAICEMGYDTNNR